jgi:predicted nucleotidyltransferase
MGIDERLTTEVVRRILGVSKPERVILFGSAALGEFTPDSDLDLLVLEPAPVDTRQRSVLFADALRGLGLPFDVIVMTSDRFEETKDVIGGVAYPAHKFGRVIYESS